MAFPKAINQTKIKDRIGRKKAQKTQNKRDAPIFAPLAAFCGYTKQTANQVKYHGGFGETALPSIGRWLDEPSVDSTYCGVRIVLFPVRFQDCLFQGISWVATAVETYCSNC